MNPSEAVLAKSTGSRRFGDEGFQFLKKKRQSGSLPGGTVSEISAAVLSGMAEGGAVSPLRWWWWW